MTKLKGRPVLKSGQRNKKIDARFTQEEFEIILSLERELGIRRTDLIRIRVLNEATNLVINARELITQLDRIGDTMGKAGAGIAQLARYADSLNEQLRLSPLLVERYNSLLEQYNNSQQSLEVVLRKIVRRMGK